MIWAWVLLGIAVAGLVMLICYAVWLAHLTADVLSELAVLGDQAGQLADLLGEVGAAERGPSAVPTGARSSSGR